MMYVLTLATSGLIANVIAHGCCSPRIAFYSRVHWMVKHLLLKEYEELKDLDPGDEEALKEFALANQTDQRGKYRPVLALKNNRLHAQNYVGIIETRKETVLEILPKVDFADSTDGTDSTERTQKVFLDMLRDWRGLKWAQFNKTSIKAVRRFNMLEVFVHVFLTNLVLLTQRGLARHYQRVEDNLPCLRGRILFPQHIRENLVNRARFYVGYDEFTADRPANRLIHSTIHKLIGFARQASNQQLLHQLRIGFADVQVSTRLERDWQRHRVDRSMQHYDVVMQWVRLFLFNDGLATFADKHVNQALLFPMEEVFENFVTACFRRHLQEFSVQEQGPREYLVLEEVFAMRPDISLERGDERFILDVKWKRINEDDNDPKHGISQADMYQLFAYGKKYGCRHVALVYPKTNRFREPLRYKFDEELALSCFPFDVTKPEKSVREIIDDLSPRASAS